MLYTIAWILLVLWLLDFLVFHLAGGLIHLVLVVAVIVFLVGFVRGQRATVYTHPERVRLAGQPLPPPAGAVGA